MNIENNLGTVVGGMEANGVGRNVILSLQVLDWKVLFRSNGHQL